MEDSPRGEVTSLLSRLRHGDQPAQEALFGIAYERLRRMAHRLMRAERGDHTLQPSELVNEAVASLLNAGTLAAIRDSTHFYASLAKAMRNLLISHERARVALKRGADVVHKPLDAASGLGDSHSSFRRVDFHDALETLGKWHARASNVVLLRYYAGYSLPEVAEELGISTSTVESDWRFARAWLRRQLDPSRLDQRSSST